MNLSDAKVRTLKTPGRHFDGGGLYLEVKPTGARYWRLKYRFGGREKLLALGVYPEVSLKAAREGRDDARRALARGEDPGELRKATKAQAEHEAVNTFRAVAEDWLKHQASSWAPGTLTAIESAFKSDVFPSIGGRPMAQIRPREVAALVKAIEARGAAEMAGRVLQRIRAVYRYAVVHERIEANPMLDLKPSELLKPRQVRHRAAMQDKAVPAFLAALDTYGGDVTTVTALRLLMLTAVRPGELRGARWDEIDADAAVWRIPAERMKMKAPHVVPLSRQALALIEGMRPISGGRELVFPSPYYPGKPLSENTLNGVLARLGYKGEHSAHGFRALFSTVANECGHDPDVIERQLAHVQRNEVRAAYHRAEYLEDRARLMQWWADYLDGRKGGKVIGFARKVAA
jgi:integrase